MTHKSPYDCTRCGACCYNLAQNHPIGFRDYVQVKPGDAILSVARLMRRYVVENDAGEFHMKLDDKEQRCAALRGTLGKSIECSIYEHRPGVCRALQPGSEGCVKSRRERGLEVFE